jgi:hypothetical protein
MPATTMSALAPPAQTSSSMALSGFGRRRVCITRLSNESRYKTFCE